MPDEYRAFVREGILEWNKAFEKIGFRDAIEVRQQENEDFDPEDINYNTFRWIATDQGFAMGPSRANPLTGEILDADIIFDASMVRFYRNEAHIFGGSGAATMMDADPISPIAGARKGAGLEQLDLLGFPRRLGRSQGQGAKPQAEARWRAIQAGVCQCGPCLKRELNLAAMTLALREPSDEKPAAAATEELIGQAIKEVTMHEVGHTLGLRHNFKASTMLDNEDLHNTAITRKQGPVGLRHGLRADQPRSQGGQAGRLLLHHPGALRLLGDRVRLQAALRRHRGRVRGAAEDRLQVGHSGP